MSDFDVGDTIRVVLKSNWGTPRLPLDAVFTVLEVDSDDTVLVRGSDGEGWWHGERFDRHGDGSYQVGHEGEDAL